MHMSAPMIPTQQHLRNQNQSIIANERTSHVSSDEPNDLYAKESKFQTRNYSTYNNHSHHNNAGTNDYQQYNGTRQTIIDSNHQSNNSLNTKEVTDHVSDVTESLKRMKHENGINSSVSNDEFNNFTPSINNNYQSEISAEDAASENTTQSHTYSTGNINKTNQSMTTTVLPSKPTRNFTNSLLNSSNAPNNYKNTSITLLNDMKNLLTNGNSANDQRRDFLNGFNSRRNSRASDENGLLNEKISDIFVNRNPGKLYIGNNSNYVNKMSNGDLLNQSLENSVKRTQDFGYKNKSFYLHENNKSVGNNDTKVYNIFSKQRMAKPIKYDQTTNNDDDEENSYLLIKMPSATKKKSRNLVHERSDSFDDDELDKLLGSVF